MKHKNNIDAKGSKTYRQFNWRKVTGPAQGYRTAIAVPNPAVPPTASSFGGNELPPDQLAICGMGRGLADIPPVHPAVGRYRQTNGRQGDKFAKKKLSIYF